MGGVGLGVYWGGSEGGLGRGLRGGEELEC